jgi:sugar-specific transcriptional regulator TrmB
MSKKKDMLLSAGLNDLEADVYLCLLDEDLLTGYKIGKLLGKPTANVYKAIDSLARKGALMIEDKQKGLCKAVPAVDFFTAAEAASNAEPRRRKRLLQELARSRTMKTPIS